MANNNNKISNLVEALIMANENAMLKANVSDSGSCNVDSVVIKLNRWRESDIEEVKKLSGVYIGGQLSGYWKGYRFVGTTRYGQADRRSAMVEMAYNSLNGSGYDVMLYSQMD